MSNLKIPRLILETDKAFSLAAWGFTGHGKSTYIKEIIRLAMRCKRTPFIYDVQKEHQELQQWPNGLPKFSSFLDMAMNRKNSVIVIEEATIFVKNTSRIDEINSLVVNKRHAGENGNVIIFIYHSLRKIPVDVADMMDYLVGFASNDRETLIRNKFRDDEELLELFYDIKEHTEGAISKEELKLIFSKCAKIPYRNVTDSMMKELPNIVRKLDPADNIRIILLDAMEANIKFYYHNFVEKI